MRCSRAAPLRGRSPSIGRKFYKSWEKRKFCKAGEEILWVLWGNGRSKRNKFFKGPYFFWQCSDKNCDCDSPARTYSFSRACIYAQCTQHTCPPGVHVLSRCINFLCVSLMFWPFIHRHVCVCKQKLSRSHHIAISTYIQWVLSLSMKENLYILLISPVCLLA